MNNPNPMEVPPTSLDRHESGESWKSSDTLRSLGLLSIARGARSTVATVNRGLAAAGGALFGGNLGEVTYDPHTPLFEQHASKSKNYHKSQLAPGSEDNYDDQIENYTNLIEQYGNQYDEAVREVEGFRRQRDEHVRLAKEFHAKMKHSIDMAETAEKNEGRQQQLRYETEVKKAISNDIVKGKCNVMATATTQEARAFARLDKPEHWKVHADTISAKLTLLLNCNFPKSEHCPVEEEAWRAYRARGASTGQDSHEFKAYAMNLVEYKPPTASTVAVGAATTMPAEKTTDFDFDEDKETGAGFEDAKLPATVTVPTAVDHEAEYTKMLLEQSNNPKLPPKKRKAARMKLSVILNSINEDDEDDEEKTEAFDREESSRGNKRAKLNDGSVQRLSSGQVPRSNTGLEQDEVVSSSDGQADETVQVSNTTNNDSNGGTAEA